MPPQPGCCARRRLGSFPACVSACTLYVLCPRMCMNAHARPRAHAHCVQTHMLIISQTPHLSREMHGMCVCACVVRKRKREPQYQPKPACTCACEHLDTCKEWGVSRFRVPQTRACSAASMSKSAFIYSKYSFIFVALPDLFSGAWARRHSK